MKKLLFFFAFICLTSFVNAQWQQTSLDSVEARCFTTKGDTIFAGSMCDGLYLSQDNGNSWSACDTNGLTNTCLQSLIIKRDTIFVGTDLSTGASDAIYYSLNNGNNWIGSGLVYNQALSLVINEGNIFVATDYGVYSSVNGGNWNITGLVNKSVRTLIVNDSNIFAGTLYNGVFMSSDNGNNWNALNNGLTNLSNLIVFSFAIKGDTIYAGTNFGVFLSLNYGSSWVSINNGLPTNSQVQELVLKGDTIIAGMYGGVYMSLNNGSSWTAINNGLPSNAYVTALFINMDTLFAGIDSVIMTPYQIYARGVWKMGLSNLASEINKFEIYNNITIYPDPATNNFTIESPQKSTIEILNTQGQTVLRQSIQQGKTGIDISGLAKGVYILRLNNNDKTEMTKILKE
jgi:photosystem II stability/assembly factor-like uncharacterized protein